MAVAWAHCTSLAMCVWGRLIDGVCESSPHTKSASVKISQDGTQLRRRAVEGLVHHTPSGIVHGYVDISQLTTEPHLVEHNDRSIWVSKTVSGRIQAYAPFDSTSPAKRNLDDPGEVNGVYLYYDTMDTQGADDTNLSDIANQFANQMVDQQLSSLCITIINSNYRQEMIGTLDLYGKDGSVDGNRCNTPQ
ncbi:potential regulator of transcription factor [Pseudozyma hubeiensis SY62]|uniref:Potential regulator of transcription factor n=1 Tax=Pseudozyma hubeiensis (strain SY62) TaxID=1305764 RepID=R9PC78_PSEHS|nr:potential regulator of transcription factor [Pseudozyma hubeiensis SY62]GAC95685.1 potential regulator of transcription factor [Pseudozyma hubeiensis SY62]